jgi:DNA-binding transcriptional MerR regulator
VYLVLGAASRGEDQDSPRFRIGELVRRFGLNVRTLRYYEATGLLPAPARTESGYRLYSEADARRLRFVLQTKRIGFSLEEIQRLLHLGGDGAACGYVRETFVRHLAAIDAQIAGLRRLRAELSAAAAAWQEPGTSVSGPFCGLIERWSSSLEARYQEIKMATRKRQVEVFTAGCPICEPVVELVQRIACPSCDVTVHNVKDDPRAAGRAKAINVQRLPMVLVDGKPAECCQIGPVTEAGLRAAGVGTS